MKVRLSITTVAAVLALVGPSAALAGSSPDDRALPRGTTWNEVHRYRTTEQSPGARPSQARPPRTGAS